MRVCVGPLEVAGMGHGWVQGLRGLGVDARLVCGVEHPFTYSCPSGDGPVLRAWARLGTLRTALPRRRFVTKAAVVLAHTLLGWCVLAWAAMRFDAFVFLFGRTLTNTTLELRLLRGLGKRVVVVFQGSDARPAYVDGSLFPSDRPFDAATVASRVREQRRHVQQLERFASAVINARATAQFLTRPFVNWFAIGIPRLAEPAPMPSDLGGVRVLHSPSHPVLKGTPEIRLAIERLQARGLPVELRTIQGRPNAEVLQALRDCHVVVDQLYSDTPMAGFATEAASLGRPVVVGSCAAGQGAAQIAPLPMPPSVYIRPEQVEAALEALVRDAPRREALGRAGTQFVAQYWSPPDVASRLLRVLRGDIPPQWFCDPTDLLHVVGCGLSEAVARERVAAVIRHGGIAALQVAHNPALERAFAEFAGVAAP